IETVIPNGMSAAMYFLDQVLVTSNMGTDEEKRCLHPGFFKQFKQPGSRVRIRAVIERKINLLIPALGQCLIAPESIRQVLAGESGYAIHPEKVEVVGQ